MSHLSWICENCRSELAYEEKSMDSQTLHPAPQCPECRTEMKGPFRYDGPTKHPIERGENPIFQEFILKLFQRSAPNR